MGELITDLPKIDKVYIEATLGVNPDEIADLHIGDKKHGYQPQGDDAIQELTDQAKRFMDKFGIGDYLDTDLWSDTMREEIMRSIKKMFNPVTEEPQPDKLQLLDEIEQRAPDKYDRNEIARVARTETSKMRSVMQLLQWKEAGMEKVKYRTQEDSKVRPSHQELNGEVFEIDYLLQPQNNDERIPRDPNCRCRYEPHITGTRL